MVPKLPTIKFAGDWGAAAGIDPSKMLVIGRKVSDVDAQHLRAQGKTPRQAAEWLVNDQRPTYEANPHIVYWEGNNEPIWNDTEGMAWYAQMEIERMKILEGIGLRAVIGNFSTGVPPLELWPAFIPACQYARDHSHILGLHEYSTPFIWWMTGAYQMEAGADCRTSDGRLAGWTTLRYRQVYDRFLQPAGLGDLSLVITEFGLDPLVSPIPDNWPGGTFRQLGNFWREGPAHWGVPLPDDFVPEGGWHFQDRDRFYFEQLWWYDQHMRRDDFVLGATIFTAGSFGEPWSSFDVEGSQVVPYMADYIRQSRTEEPPPPPPPPPPSVPVTDGFDAPVGTEAGRREEQLWPGDWFDAIGYAGWFKSRSGWQCHTGVDLNRPAQRDLGEPVYAVANGVVAFAGKLQPGWGNVVVVAHTLPGGGKVWSRYAHLLNFTVAQGDVMRRGDQLGFVGDADGQWPPHLHLDIAVIDLGQRPGDWPGADKNRVLRDYLDPLAFIREHRPGAAVSPFGKCLVGLGAANPWPFEQADYDVIAVSDVELIKILVPGQEASDVQRLIGDGKVVMARLFEKPGDRHLTATEFVANVANAFEEIYQAGVRYFEIHNEPNLPQDGLGVSWANGAEFAQWFIEVYNALKARHPDVQLGYPGLSPQFNNWSLPYEADLWVFARASEAALLRADWIGVHGYWWYEGDGHWGMLNQANGMLWRQFISYCPGKPIIITEFSNNNPAVGYAIKGDQYGRYYQMLRHEPGLVGAAAFALYWPGQDDNREGWRNDSGMTDIPREVGRVEF